MSVFLVETIIIFSIFLLVCYRKDAASAVHDWFLPRYRQTYTNTDWMTFCNNKQAFVVRLASLIRPFACSFFVLSFSAITLSPPPPPPSRIHLLSFSHKHIISSASIFLHTFCRFVVTLADSILVFEAIYCRKTFIIIQLRYWFFFETRKRSLEAFLTCCTTRNLRER